MFSSTPHIYRNQTCHASDHSRNLMLEPRRGSCGGAFSVTIATLLYYLFFFSRRKVRPGVQWEAGTVLRQSWLPKEPGELCQGQPSALLHRRGESWWGDVEKRPDGNCDPNRLSASPKVHGDTAFLTGAWGKKPFLLVWLHVLLTPPGLLNLQANTHTYTS